MTDMSDCGPPDLTRDIKKKIQGKYIEKFLLKHKLFPNRVGEIVSYPIIPE